MTRAPSAKQADPLPRATCGRAAALFLFVCIVLGTAGCGTAPRAPGHDARTEVPPSGPGVALVRAAAQFIGTPYRYGGDDPRGFDCSGLVFYTHDLLGLRVPRTALAQMRAAHPVAIDSLQPGDLVFFRVRKRQVDHVGIYAGDGKFIHAPSSGRVVSYAYLDDPWYRSRFAAAGRLWAMPSAAARP